jgi:ribosome-associated protein
MALIIKNGVTIADHELDIQAIRAQGSGGQNVNKVSSAIHLRFDIRTSTLPEVWKERLCGFSDQRITDDGVIVIKAQQFRTQEKNREDALERLRQLILAAVAVQKPRKPTKPTRASQERRRDSKVLRGRVKAARGRVRDE